ncbi:hypothetical protein ACH5RR_029305 [Cinchona calisaya]|uniref:DNA-directed RNA polymerase n=1 Tax=Cinchona calisaya TaxID=153742 RepID=A0ABD2YUP2_9GENT
MMTESDGETNTLFPKAARLRNLTYSSPLYVDVTKRVLKKEQDSEEVTEAQEFTKVFIGKVPIMLQSSYCSLYHKPEKDLNELGERPFDQGGYFKINGSEKVLIAQEKMSTNHVYVFKKRQPNNRTVEALLVCDFAVLEVISDIKPWKQQHSRDAHLQVIKQHGRTFSKLPARSCCASLRKPMKEMPAGWYAKELLQKEMLPHVGTAEYCETKKAYYFGYIIHRLLFCALGRRPEDGRDHYANKGWTLLIHYLEAYSEWSAAFTFAILGKLAKPRQLHNSHWGMMCPAETPEGQACGLVKNLALMVYVTVGSAANPILEFLEEWSTENFEEISPAVIPHAYQNFCEWLLGWHSPKS